LQCWVCRRDKVVKPVVVTALPVAARRIDGGSSACISNRLRNSRCARVGVWGLRHNVSSLWRFCLGRQAGKLRCIGLDMLCSRRHATLHRLALHDPNGKEVLRQSRASLHTRWRRGVRRRCARRRGQLLRLLQPQALQLLASAAALGPHKVVECVVAVAPAV
jgi:hypothetical protein